MTKPFALLTTREGTKLNAIRRKIWLRSKCFALFVSGQIVDDEMNALLVQRLPPGVRLTAIFDSCHSATALDLPYIYDCDGNIKKQKASRKKAGYKLQKIFIQM